jgi:enamine deaminase RidA (YjgF/YER057c/UK114 family)
MNSSIEQPSKAFVLLHLKTLYKPQAFAYSHIAEVIQFQRILHISGQGGENQRGLLSTDFAVQVRQAFQNIERTLIHVHATLQDTAVLRILVVNHNPQKHQFLIQEMQKRWKDQPFPACTLIPVPCLALAGMLIEIEATAYCQ